MNSPYQHARTVMNKPFKEALLSVMEAYPHITNAEAQQAIRDASIVG